jgi:hypothetical protein
MNQERKIVTKENLGKRVSQFVVFSFVLPVIVELIAVARGTISYDTTVDPEIINGILTVSAIVFGFSTITIQKSDDVRILNIFLLQITLLGGTGVYYFMEFMSFKHATPLVLIMAIGSMLTILFCTVIIQELYYGIQKEARQTNHG